MQKLKLNNLRASTRACIAAGSVAAILISGLNIFRDLQTRSESAEVPEITRHGPTAPGFNPKQVVPLFPAITNVPVVTVSSVGDEIGAEELVLGVEVDGQARAYPINMLTGPSREIINDRIGNTALAATW